MDAHMDISIIVNILIALIMLTSATFVWLTILSNNRLNQKILFNEIVKQERELRIKLNEYKEKIDDPDLDNAQKEITKVNYDTLLFNYYEYLAICVYKKSLSDDEVKLYFLFPLRTVKNWFESSILFEKGYVKKEQYPEILWLSKKWEI